MTDDRGAPGDVAGRLAHVHLHTGMLRLARVELEELAGAGALDDDGVLDLAEARWRTGDLRGAAEAAGVWLEADGGTDGGPNADRDSGTDPAVAAPARRARALAHAVVAEGLTVRGRHDDATIHVEASLEALRGSGLDPDGSDAGALAALFGGIVPRADGWPVPESRDTDAGAEDEAADARAPRVFAPSFDPAAPDALAAAEGLLAGGEDAAAAVLLMLALRAAPGRAPEILDQVELALGARRSAPLLLARAEALGAVGRHDEARIAYAVAASHARGAMHDPSPLPDGGAVPPEAAWATGTDAVATPDPERSIQ